MAAQGEKILSQSDESTDFVLMNSILCPSLYIYREPRYFSGILTAVASAFLTYALLEPYFYPSTELARMALFVLSAYAAGVGMSLGVLLPVIFPGAALGAALALMIGCLFTITASLYFPLAAPILAAVGGYLSFW